MNLRTLAGYSLSMANGSHRAPITAGKQRRTHVSVFEGGSAFTSCAEVRNAVTQLCGVRRIKTGKVTICLDGVHDTKRLDAAGRREKKRVEGIEEQKRKDANKGVKFNTAMEVSLAQTEEALNLRLILKCLAAPKVLASRIYKPNIEPGNYGQRRMSTRGLQSDLSTKANIRSS
jgi:hypothetical protein